MADERSLAAQGRQEGVLLEGTLTKQGSSKKGQSGGLWKKRYFVLLGSTLTFYESEKKEGTVRVFQLQGATVSCRDSVKGKRSPFTIHGETYDLRLGSSTIEERMKWVEAITKARDKDPCAARYIQGNRRSQSNVTMRAEKKAASAALKTKKGREYVKEHIPPDSPASALLDAFLAWTIACLGEKDAGVLEQEALQVLIKAMILDKHNVLDTPLMRTSLPNILRVCECICDFKDNRSRFHVQELRQHLLHVTEISLEVIAPHVKENTMDKCRRVFAFVVDPERLNELFLTDTHAKQRDELVDAVQDAYYDVDRECDTYFLEFPGARIVPWWKQAMVGKDTPDAPGAAHSSGQTA